MKISDICEGITGRTRRKRLSSAGSPGKKGKVYHYEYEDAVVPFQVQQVFHVGGTLGGGHTSKVSKRSKVATSHGLVSAITERILETDDHRELNKLGNKYRYQGQLDQITQVDRDRMGELRRQVYQHDLKRDDIFRAVAEDLIAAGVIQREDLGYALDDEPDY